MAVDNTTIGTFELWPNRTWTFKYTESFKRSDLPTLEEFPLVECAYGHEACMKWLSAHLIPGAHITKGYSLAEAIGRHREKQDTMNDPLELHALH